jgi:pilus assembly protein CpaF
MSDPFSGDVPVRQLVINSLRMRPNRIIVGEVRGAEALDMLQAMNTGHDGSLTTIHANSPRDALARMETMVMPDTLHDEPVREVDETILQAGLILLPRNSVRSRCGFPLQRVEAFPE